MIMIPGIYNIKKNGHYVILSIMIFHHDTT